MYINGIALYFKGVKRDIVVIVQINDISFVRLIPPDLFGVTTPEDQPVYPTSFAAVPLHLQGRVLEELDDCKDVVLLWFASIFQVVLFNP